MSDFIVSVVRRLMGIKPPQISMDDAYEIAKDACLQKGWSWDNPVNRHVTLRTYRFYTKADRKGGNAYVNIDIHTGVVESMGKSLR